MKRYSLTLTRNYTNGVETETSNNNMSLVELSRALTKAALDIHISSFVFTVGVLPEKKHPAPFAKTKAGQRRRAERNFTAQGAYDDLWGPPLEDPMGWEQ